MSQFNSLDIEFQPLQINNDIVLDSIAAPTTTDEDIAIVDKLMEHLNLIKQYNDRLAAIDYLSDNAAKLAQNPSYTTNDPRLIANIKELGGSGGYVDFLLFQKAVDIVIEGYQAMALNAITGVNNA